MRSTLRSVAVLVTLLFPAAAFAVWPMPSYSQYPNCTSTTPAENCSQQVGPVDMHWQTKLSDRSVQFGVTYFCTPVENYGYCDANGCTSQGGFCRQPAIVGTPTAKVETTSAGTFVRFHLEYDFPGNYCQLSPDGVVGEWPIIFNDYHLNRLQVIDNASGNIVVESMAVFEHGAWSPRMPFCGTGDYTLRVVNGCQGLNQTFAIKVTNVDPTISLTPCSGDRNCLLCKLSNGGPSLPGSPSNPINAGSGDVVVSIPLFTLAQAPAPLSFTLAYHSELAANPALITQPMGAIAVPGSTPTKFVPNGWTHTFNESLRQIDPFDLELYRQRADGDESWYTATGSNTWSAARPGELRESVVRVNGQLQVTDLDRNVTTFDAVSGNWLSTADRWGNTLAGSYEPTTGLLTTVTDAEGRQARFAYTGGALTQITLPDGSAWRFVYSGGELTQIFDPVHTGSTPWRTFEYQADTRGTARLLTTMRDESGALLEGHGYDEFERGVSGYVGANREVVTLQYNGSTPTQAVVTSSIDGSTSQAATFSLIYQRGRYLPLEVNGTCASCGAGEDDTKFQFNTSNFPTQKIDGNGRITNYSYDATGNLLRKDEAAGTPLERVTTYAYGDAAWPRFLTSITESSAATPGVRTTTRAWDTTETTLTVTTTGKLRASDTNATSYVMTSTFDSRHRLLTTVGPRTDTNQTVTRSYYSDGDADINRRGRMASTTNEVGLTTTFDNYDVYGSARLITDPNGVQTATQTDARGRTVVTINKAVAGDAREASDYVSSSTYDGRDRLVRSTRPRGNATAFAYEDGTNRVTDTIRLDANSNELERRHVTFNAIGDKIREEDQQCAAPASPCGSWITKRQEDFAYDEHNRLVRIIHAIPAGSSVVYNYDSAGLLKSVQDENHAAPNTIYTYDELNRVANVRQTLGTSSISTAYRYDAEDNLASVTDPNGNITTYAYDDFQRLQTLSSPVTGTTSYTYDAAGNVITTTDGNGATSTRTYDAANRLLTTTSTHAGATESVTYTYDDPTAGNYGKGRTATVSDPAGSMRYAYDRRGMVRLESHTIEGNAYSIGYGYDANGNRSAITYPSGRVVRYEFDFADRPLSASANGTSLVTSASYLPFGPESQLVFGNGTTKSTTYDVRYRPLENKLTGGAGAIADYAYAEDGVGNITAVHDLIDATYNRDFGYDDLYRLTSANSGPSLWGAATYRYDAMGNMLALSLGNSRRSTFAYNATLPTLASVTENGSTRPVAYDAAGNEQTVGATSYGYSPRNLLSSGDGLAYTYDARGLRTITTVNAALGTFSGTVVTAASGAPVAGATVTVDGTLNSTTSDAGGNFSLNQPAGNFTLTILKSGFLPETTTAFTLTSGATVAVGTVKLSVAPSTITGSVVSSLGGAVAGATVALSGTNASASTDASGNFSITIPAGTFTATVSAGGYTSQTTGAFSTQPGMPYSLGTITLPAIPATISGTVTSSTGGPLAGATVTASGGPNGASHNGRIATMANGTAATTDANGNFTMSLAAGTYTLAISKSGFGTATTAAFTVGPGSTFTTGTIALDPLGTITGQVVSQATGSPIAGATVTLPGSVNSVSTDTNGHFSIQQPPGTYSIHVSATGFADVTTPFFTLAPGGAYDAGTIKMAAVALGVYVGYADDLRPAANFPVPWAGTPNVIYIGSGSPIDAGAIRLDNNTDTPLPVDNVTVDLGRPGPTYNLWGSFTVPSHGSVILTQTSQFNFDTSDSPIISCGGTLVAGDPRVPRVVVTSSGVSTTYYDTGHILDTGGYDLACSGNESLQWRLIGTTGINANGDFLLGPPTGTSPLGQPYTVTAKLTDGTGQPLPNVTIKFTVISGPNINTTGSGITDPTGTATFTYTGHSAGTDTLQASITNASGAVTKSNPVTVAWPAFTNIAVFVGYADDLRAGAAFPNPWQGSPNVVYIGSGLPIDAGAIRIDNVTDQPVKIDGVNVDLERPGPNINLWGTFTIPARGSAILTQTTQYNFDTSDFPIVGCFGTISPADTRIPKITITTGGQSASYLDTSHILDTFGYDLANCPPGSNESLQWRPVGSSSTASAGHLALRPLATVSAVGATYTATAVATDAGNEPVAGLAVDFRVVTGPNSGKTGRATTDANGLATFSYVSTVTGTDTVRASITNSVGAVLTSNDVTSSWVANVSVQLSPSAATSTVGTPYNATALVADGSNTPLANVFVTFRITAGPNAGKTGQTMTDAIGHAVFTYFSTVTGTDTLVASIVGGNGTAILSNQVTSAWVAPMTITLEPSSATNPIGSNYTATAFVAAAGAPSSGASVTFNVVAGPDSGKALTTTTDGTGHASFTFTSQTIGTDVVQATTANLTSNQVVAKWIAIPTTLTFNGAFSGEYDDPMTLTATLRQTTGGAAVAGQPLTFVFGSQTLSATTDASGAASVTLTPTVTPGAVPLRITFAGAGAYSGTSTSLFINIVKDESAIRYTGKTVVANGTSQTLTALLTDPDGGAPLANRSVTFTIGPLTASAVTDASGVASASMTVSPSLGTGPIRLDVAFAGDATNVPAYTSVPVILYQPQSFVIWGANSVQPRVGDHVNFWGSQWPKQVSAGDYDNKSDFKGWAVPTVSPLVSCEVGQHADGKCWSSKPGQSFPPATIERYVSVIVSTSIAQAHGDIVGNIAATVVVRVDPIPPYGNDPGKPGFGTIVAVIDDAAHLFAAATSRPTRADVNTPYFFRHVANPRAPQVVSLLKPNLGETMIATELMALDRSITPILRPAPLTVASGNRRYSFYSPEMNLIAETSLSPSGTPAIAYEYVWFDGHPVAQLDATGATHWTFTDHLGTPIVLTNSDQSVYWRAEYEPFGAVFALRSTDTHQPLRLPGQEAEQLDLGANGVTEREYNIHRWYRGAWGRYTQLDPWFAMTQGSYGYADEKPIDRDDPFGLYTVIGPGKTNIDNAMAMFRSALGNCNVDPCNQCWQFFHGLGLDPAMLQPGSPPTIYTGVSPVPSSVPAYGIYNVANDWIWIDKRLATDTNLQHRRCLASKLAHEIAHFLVSADHEGPEGREAEQKCFGHVYGGSSECGF